MIEVLLGMKIDTRIVCKGSSAWIKVVAIITLKKYRFGQSDNHSLLTEHTKTSLHSILWDCILAIVSAACMTLFVCLLGTFVLLVAWLWEGYLFSFIQIFSSFSDPLTGTKWQLLKLHALPSTYSSSCKNHLSHFDTSRFYSTWLNNILECMLSAFFE